MFDIRPFSRHSGESRNRSSARAIFRDAGVRRNDACEEKESGFTLVELMVVIVIIGLLATVVMINVLPNQDRAMVEKTKADISTLGQALEMYRLDNLAYPGPGEGLQALMTPPPTLAQPARYRSGGYIKNLPNDPWGRPYQYAVPGRKGAFDIYSLGADGAPGGENENADIYSSDI